MAYPYDGILFSLKKEWNTDTFYNGWTWKHAKWNTPDTKGHILNEPIHGKCLE